MKTFSKITSTVLAAGVAAAASFATPAAAAPVLGAPIVVSRTGDVIATFLGSDAFYTSEVALQGRVGTLFNTKTTAAGTSINLGHFLAGTLLTFDFNVLDTGDTFHSGPATGNADGAAHVAVDYLPHGSGLGFEDIRGGGDRDYNDLIAHVSNTGASAVPEPATWSLLILGFGAVGAAMRRRTSTAVSYA